MAEQLLADGREKLHAMRAERPRPHLDDKVSILQADKHLYSCQFGSYWRSQTDKQAFSDSFGNCIAGLSRMLTDRFVATNYVWLLQKGLPGKLVLKHSSLLSSWQCEQWTQH